MTVVPYSVPETLHHEAPMILIEEILAYDGETIKTATTITEESPFMVNGAIPAYVAIEYMAQTIGVYNGIECLDAAMPVKIGFLLGTRDLKLHCAAVKPGERLEVEATAIYKDEEMFSFDCKVTKDRELFAEAIVNAYSPKAEN